MHDYEKQRQQKQQLFKVQFFILLFFYILGQQEYMILCYGIVILLGEVIQYSNVFRNLKEIIKDLPRHHFLEYGNRYSLPEKMIQQAYQTAENGYVYIVLSDTGSPASELISMFTKKQYNHVSIAFDEKLQTMVSYNNGEKRFPPGLNIEKTSYFRKKEGACIIVYKLPATPEQKRSMISKIEQINREGSSYNTAGLLLKHSFQPNIMFCSQFVYHLLEYAGIVYFQKKTEYVTPMDFVELDYKRKLQFMYEKVL